MEYAIETFNLTKKFVPIRGFNDLLHPFRKREVTALEHVNLKIRKGELFGILGPNGAGKTTLIKMLCTLILPTFGTALVNGYDIAKEEEKVKASMGLVTGEERSFYWRLTGRQNLIFFASLHKFSSSEVQKRVNDVLHFVDLEDKAADKFHSYSTGMKQRMAIARGLLNEPEILFMDEPTKSLDPGAAQHLREFIKERLVKDQGKTVFLSTHHLGEAEELCDRIALINKGGIKACGTLSELRGMIEKREKYIIKVTNFSDSVFAKLHDLEGVITLSTHVQSDVVTLEIQLSDSELVLPQIIDTIVNVGGKIHACHSKEIDINDLFTQLMNDAGGMHAD
ncbi:ABC-2 type transport system ATP-binding protein [Candidatus Methanophagaceae archaeon]|nr:ABC-2 type transport system ATP-binding protein [Methanophagales archaeon]